MRAVGLPVPEGMAGPGCEGLRIRARLVGKAPSCFRPLVGADGARPQLPLAPDNPKKASSLVGATK